jgi:hypothetical protein
MDFDRRPFVTCWIMGQLGNQLFQIATTLAYGWDYDAIALFPYLHKQEDRISYNKDRIFFRLNASAPPRNALHVFEETRNHFYKKIPFKKDQLLFGYFQCWKHFHHHRDHILSILSPSKTVLDTLDKKYSPLISQSNTVAVHVRTQNKRAHELKIHEFLGLEYYEKVMRLFPENSQFVVFSDRINWCKKHFPKLGKNFIFIEGNDLVEDLFLMSMMKHIIICNSTFSWWGAYLNQNPNRLVVAPQSFLNPNINPNFSSEDVFLPDWKLVMPAYDAAYPDDMLLYHQESVNG